MSVLHRPARKSSARQQIDINGVRDSILLLPGGKYRKVLAVSSVNFELRSEAEQDAIIETYESFLNSVGAPLQIIIRTREIDLDKYLGELSERLQHEKLPIYKRQLRHYNDFIRSLITTNKILTRHFYVVVEFDTGGKSDFDIVSEHLQLRADIIQKGLSRLGMQSRELSDLELLDLFYSFYSPKQAKVQPLAQQAIELLHNAFTISKGEIS